VLLAVVAIMRLVAWDDIQVFAILNCVTAFVYLPAWIVVVVAVVCRRPVFLSAGLLIVGAQLLFLWPELSATRPVPAWARNAPALQILDANVYSENPSMAGYAAEISSMRPQLVIMEESTPADVVQLGREGALKGLPYRFEVYRYDPFAFFVASRYPLFDTRVIYLYGRPLMVQTTLELPSGPQPLWAVHTIAPVPVSFAQWKGQLADIAHLVRTRGPRGLLIVGDFNATWNSLGFRGILADGVSDGAAARGRAFDMTWSQMMPPLPPFVRIDHVLTGPGVAVTHIGTVDGPGSDHRGLIATVAFERSR
jgi:endonuclease/exonuclease/phosphatase (EEP) superfamily protein YafD